MKSLGARTGGRSVGLLILAIAIAGVVGSVVSHFMAGVFPDGPVRDFFFRALELGIPAFTVSLGFMTFTFGLAFSITAFSVILVVLAGYLWYKL
jgi:energy-converting hydrogenase Eha subunit E